MILDKLDKDDSFLSSENRINVIIMFHYFKQLKRNNFWFV